VTTPTGRSFLSYRRACAADAELLIAAQHDIGIPTWQDVRNLPEEPAEEAIRQVLRDPTTANAILWLTPEIADSPMIQRVEIPEILRRFEQVSPSPGAHPSDQTGGDGRGGRGVRSRLQAPTDAPFFVLPVLARGLDYPDVDTLLDPRFAAGLQHWNLRRIPSPHPITPPEAAQVAAWVLERRLAAIHQSLPPDAPLRLSLFTREPAPFEPDTIALSLDWSRRFAGREAHPGAWHEHLLPALRTVALQIRAQAGGRNLEAEGLPSLAACVALGCAFVDPRRPALAWRQTYRGTEQLWSLHAPAEDSGYTAHTRSLDLDARDLAVLVSVTQNVEPAFAASSPDLPRFRALIHLTRSGDDYPQRLAGSGEAVDLVEKILRAVKSAQATYRDAQCTHLFLAVPAAVALMIGQLANTLGPLQTYEHVPVDAVGRYRLVVRLTA
jgi:hypothetical protein